MRFQLQIAVAALAAMSALSGPPVVAADAARPAGAPLPLSGGWTARLFVEPLQHEPIFRGDAVIAHSPLGMNMRLSRPLGRDARLVVEGTNLFDRDTQRWRGLAPPADGRGLRIEVRKTF